jgi:5-deoxy-glucuronate isomerase
MNLKKTYYPHPGCIEVFSPGDSGRFGFSLLNLTKGMSKTYDSGDSETAVVILSGTCLARINDKQIYESIGGRGSVFSGNATAIYLPNNTKLELASISENAEIAFCSAIVKTSGGHYLVRPDDVKVRQVGHGNFLREVHDVIAMNARAETILVGETFTPAGHWSSFPPHKHDENIHSTEVRQEEVYFYKTNPVAGFALQYVYSSDENRPIDVAFPVRNNDIVHIPYGYHPVSASPGYDLYYLWFLFGGDRIMLPNDDRNHSWIRECRT